MINKNEALFVVSLPFGQKTVPYNELALLIGEAKTPGFDRETASDSDRQDMAFRWVDMERPLLDAVRAGELEVLNPFTLRRLKPPFAGRLFDSSLVTVRALRDYVESIHGCLEIGDAPEPQAAKPSPAPTVSSASNAPARARRDLLAPVIEAAQKECEDQFDAPAVWASLVCMAGAGKRPLLGVCDDGIKWQDSNDEPQFLNIKNLRDRLIRSKKKAR